MCFNCKYHKIDNKRSQAGDHMVNIISSFKDLRTKFDRQVWLLFAGMIINVLGTSLVMPFLSIYMYEKMNISMTEIGIAFFIATVMGAISAYIGGALCDRYGRKRLFMIGLIFQILAYLLISVSIDFKVSYIGMVMVLTVAFFIDGLYRSVPEVMVADVVPPGDRVEAYGLLRIGANLGWVIGPMLGGALALFAMSYSSMFYVTAFTTFVYLLLVVFMLRDTKPSSSDSRLSFSDVKRIVRDTPFLLFCIISLLIVIPYSQMYSLLSVYSSAYIGMTEFEIGLFFSLSGIMVATMQYPLSLVVKRYRMTMALALCCVVFALGFGILALAKINLLVYFSVAIITVAEMIWSPASATLQANMSPEDRRGRYFGFSGLVFTMGFAIGPLFGGVLKDSFEYNTQYMWLAISGIFIVGLLLFMGLNRYIPKDKNVAMVAVKDEEAVIKEKGIPQIEVPKAE
ncbi:MFS transporter [Methanocella sp. CWC-04]|uniref:MFS transporter n=1 Tax=Methanooceanicella nereidis TaxID=2052831 RepID=A0AAP2RE83_9EURY|nr:MFS transporter [Methanocella sp. CWC-04]